MTDPAKNPYAPATSDLGGQSSGGQSSGGQRPTTIASAARTSLVLAGGLAMGVVSITAILLFLKLPELPEGEPLFRFVGDEVIYLGVGYGLFLGCVATAILLPTIMRQSALSVYQSSTEPLPQPLRDDSTLPSNAQTLLASVMASTLVRHALLEGPAVINAILFFISGNFAHLIAIPVCIAGILGSVPTAGWLRALLVDASRDAVKR